MPIVAKMVGWLLCNTVWRNKYATLWFSQQLGLAYLKSIFTPVHCPWGQYSLGRFKLIGTYSEWHLDVILYQYSWAFIIAMYNRLYRACWDSGDLTVQAESVHTTVELICLSSRGNVIWLCTLFTPGSALSVHLTAHIGLPQTALDASRWYSSVLDREYELTMCSTIGGFNT